MQRRFRKSRCRFWITFASTVEVVVDEAGGLAENFPIELRLFGVVGTWRHLHTSSAPKIAAVTCTPPGPQP